MLIFSDLRPMLPSDSSGVLRSQENLEQSVTLSGGVITENVRSAAAGISALFKSGSYRGFSSVSGITEKNAKKVLDEASRNFQLTGAVPSAPKNSVSSFSVIPGCTDTAQTVLIEAAREIDSLILKLCPDITGRKVRINTLSTEKHLYVFGGTEYHAVNPRTNVYVTIKSGNVSVTDSCGGIGFYEDVFGDLSTVESLISELYSDLTAKLSPEKLPSGNTETIMSDCTGILIHEAFGHIAEGDSVAEGSVLAGAIGKKVASPLISATDFSSDSFGIQSPQPLLVDDEGNVCTDAPLIKDGVFTGYMTDTASAEELSFAVTGNARAATYQDLPVVRMRNTAIHPGNSSLAEMISSTENGIYIKRTGGGQADMTGRYMFRVQTAYRIKNGTVTGALPDFTCTGNSFDTLSAVTMVGSDFRWRHSSLCGKQGQIIPVGMSGPSIKTVTFIPGGDKDE